MKGYYIPFGARSIVSVNKKIDMQKEQLSKLGAVEEVDVKIAPKSIIRYALSVLPFIDLPWDYSEAYEKIENPDYIYMRRTGADRRFIKFLRTMKLRYPECKIVCEIATYPYVREMLQSYRGWLFIGKELYNRRKLKKYIDRFVTYSDEVEILGVSTIRTLNGIDVNCIKPVSIKRVDKSVINMIVVAVMQKNHGYERVLKGIKDYYENGGSREIKVHMVGEGAEKIIYEKLVETLGIQKNVWFYGKRTGDALDEIYDKADVALSVFGLYKAGISKISSLKSKEYLAKGLPVVSGCKEDIFINNKCSFFLEFPNDNSTIDFKKVVDFYDRLYIDETNEMLVNQIREFALQNVDMEISMRPILEYIKKEL